MTTEDNAPYDKGYYYTGKIVRATTASALSGEEWRRAWELAAPVVVAAGRFLEAEKDGTPAVIEDAHFQLLAAVTQYVVSGTPPPEEQT
jgi:hypothetical protein